MVAGWVVAGCVVAGWASFEFNDQLKLMLGLINIHVKLKIPVKIKILVRGNIHVNKNAKILVIGKQHVMVKVI